MAFKCLSFKGCPWIAHWTSQDRWKVHTSVVPKRWSFSGFPFWPGPMTPETSHTSVLSRWCLWDPEDIFFITTMEAPGKLALAAHCHSDYDPPSPCLHTQTTWNCLPLPLITTLAMWIDQTSTPANGTLFPSNLSTDLGHKPLHNLSLTLYPTQLHCGSRGCSSRSSSRNSPKWRSKVQAASCFSLEISPPCSPSTPTTPCASRVLSYTDWCPSSFRGFPTVQRVNDLLETTLNSSFRDTLALLVFLCIKPTLSPLKQQWSMLQEALLPQSHFKTLWLSISCCLGVLIKPVPIHSDWNNLLMLLSIWPPTLKA